LPQNSALAAFVALSVVGLADATTHVISWGFNDVDQASITVQAGDTVTWSE